MAIRHSYRTGATETERIKVVDLFGGVDIKREVSLWLTDGSFDL